jgi:hypothetical protein
MTPKPTFVPDQNREVKRLLTALSVTVSEHRRK